MLSCITHLGYLAVVKLICARKYLPLGKLAPVSARKGLCGDDKGSLLGKGGSAGGKSRDLLFKLDCFLPLQC